MSKNLKTPEEQELFKKEEVFKDKKIELSELELNLTTLQGDLRAFEMEYYVKIGSKYITIDNLKATIDNILLARDPSSKIFQKRVRENKSKASENAKVENEMSNLINEKTKKFNPTNELKSLYRDLAKLLHPDLVLDSEEKNRRHKLMQTINEAYQNNDYDKLKHIYEEEKNNPDLIKGEDIGSSLIRIIRKLSQVESRIQHIQNEINIIKETELFTLYTTFINAKEGKNELFNKIQNDLDIQINTLSKTINALNK